MSLVDLIRQHAAAELAVMDWAGVAARVRALALRSVPRKCGSVETAAALAAVGVDWAAVMDVIDDDATGRFLLTMLAAEGVHWGHALTLPYLRAKQGAVLTESGVDALVDLSSPLLYADLTADQCRIEIQADAARQAYETIRELRQKWVAVSHAINSGISAGEITNAEEIRAAVATEFGG